MNYVLVAIDNLKGTCHKVLICKNVNKQELNRLKNEALAYEEEILREKEQYLNSIKALEERIEHLECEIAYLKGESEEHEELVVEEEIVEETSENENSENSGVE